MPRCVRCGQELTTFDNFCPRCGTPVAAAAAAPVPHIPTGPVPPTTSSSSSTPWTLVLSVAIVAVAIVATVIYVIERNGSGNPNATPGASASPTPTSTPSPTPTRFDGPLSELLLPMPPDAVPWPDADIDGDVTIEELAEGLFFDDPDAVIDYYEAWSVKRVAVRHWQVDERDVLVEIFEFPTSATARRFVNSGIEGMEREGEVPGWPRSVWYGGEAEGWAYSWAYMYSQGPLACVVEIWEVDSTDPAAGREIAERQFALLAATG